MQYFCETCWNKTAFRSHRDGFISNPLWLYVIVQIVLHLNVCNKGCLFIFFFFMSPVYPPKSVTFGIMLWLNEASESRCCRSYCWTGQVKKNTKNKLYFSVQNSDINSVSSLKKKKKKHLENKGKTINQNVLHM